MNDLKLRAGMRVSCLIVLLFAAAFVARPASALVTVDATTTFLGMVSVGQTFDVDISVTWDGAGSLTGIFASHTWDNSQLQLIGAVFPLASSFETAPQLLVGGQFDPFLSRFGTIAAGVAGDDLTRSARTVQYGALGGDALPSTSAQMALVTRLTFQVIGIGDGTIDVDGTLLSGDGGAIGDSLVLGSLIFTPEPNAALLLGLGLAALARGGRRVGADL